MDGSKKKGNAFIALQHPYCTVLEKQSLSEDRDRDSSLFNFIKDIENGKLLFKYFSLDQSKRYLQKLINLAQEAILADRPLYTGHILILDTCTLDLECFHLLAKLDGLNLCEVLGVGVECQIKTSRDVESDLLSYLSSLQLTTASIRVCEYTESFDRHDTFYYSAYFSVHFVKGAALLIDKPPEAKANKKSVITPLTVPENGQTSLRMTCMESVFVKAVLQIPTLKEMTLGYFSSDSPLFADEIFEAINRRPTASRPLFLVMPLTSKFTMKLLPLVNEKKLEYISVVIEEEIHDTAIGVIQQTLNVIETSLYLQELRVFVKYPEGLDHTLLFFRGLRKILPRLRLPLTMCLYDADLRIIDLPKSDTRLTDLDRVLEEVDSMDQLMRQKDLQNLVLLVYPKVSCRPHSLLRVLSLDIFRRLREYLLIPPVTDE